MNGFNKNAFDNALKSVTSNAYKQNLKVKIKQINEIAERITALEEHILMINSRMQHLSVRKEYNKKVMQ